jgi:hypothetical protein
MLIHRRILGIQKVGRANLPNSSPISSPSGYVVLSRKLKRAFSLRQKGYSNEGRACHEQSVESLKKLMRIGRTETLGTSSSEVGNGAKLFKSIQHQLRDALSPAAKRIALVGAGCPNSNSNVRLEWERKWQSR